MDYINKIKTQVSSFLLGNPISKDFEVLSLTCLGGPGLQWKVYEAKSKSTKQDASVWIFEKKSLDRLSKSVKEDIISIAKKGVINITKLRHPMILSVLHPLEESRESLAFASEPVYSSLANILQPDSRLPQNIIEELKDQKLFDVEIKYGILQLCEALTFLHNDCRQLHLNICPETVAVARSGAWKLAGFEFSVGSALSSEHSARDANAELVLTVSEWYNTNHPLTQPSLDYCSPEAALQGRAVAASDMFSLGMLIYSLFNSNKTFLDCQNDVNAFRKNTSELNRIRVSLLQCLPENLRDYVKLLINYESSLRLDALQLSKIPYFNDSAVNTLQSMDNLFQLDNLARSQFYKDLPKTVVSMPKRINLHRVLPQLTVEFNNNNMVPFVLPTVLQIADLCNDVEFTRFVLPKLIPVLNMTEPIQITLIILQNLNILMTKCPENEFKSYILPLLNRALEVDNRQTQELCLKIIPTVCQLMAFSTMKNIIFPRLKKLCFSTNTIQMKVSCLVCISKLMEHLDKWTVLDDVLPFLPEIKSREPAILMSILGIYQIAFNHKKLGITKEVMANKAVPFLLPLATDCNLNLAQYSAFMSLIQQMLARIDTEHRSKLEQINGIQEEYHNIPIDGGKNGMGNQQSQTNTMMNSKCGSTQSGSAAMDEVKAAFGFGEMRGQSLVQFSTAGIPGAGSQGSDNKSITGGSGGATASSLTVEEKQRLANRQEQMNQMMNQVKHQPMPQLNATNKPISVSGSKPKDLTSTLMDRNLALMSSGSGTSSIAGGNYSSGIQSVGKPNYNINLNSGTHINSSTMIGGSSLAMNQFNSSYQYGQSSGPMSLQPSSSLSLSSSSSTSTATVSKKIDTSAFDNLCSLKSSTPINQLKINSTNNKGDVGGYGNSSNQSQMRFDDLLS